jgi:hypothetical protein
VETDLYSWSPHSSLHVAAVAVAVQASRQFIDDIRAQITTGQLSQLFGVGTTIAFAIDTTGSMGDIIYSVGQECIAIIEERLGTSEQSYQFILSEFNDPAVGPLIVTGDKTVFESYLSSLSANGGGDCPENSIQGMLAAANAAAPGSSVLMMTDAAPKDTEYLSQLLDVIVSKSLKIYPFKFQSGCDSVTGRDYLSDEIYGEIAATSGGQYHSLARTDASEIHGLIDILTTSTNSFILKVSDTLNGQIGTTHYARQYVLPVDTAITRIAFSAHTTGSIVMHIYKPDGTLLESTGPDTTTTILRDGAFVVTTSPIVGSWLVEVQGQGSFDLDVTGASSLYFSDFEIVASDGRPGHRGYYPIDGQPSYDHNVGVVASIDGYFSYALFDIRTVGGAIVESLGLQHGSGTFGMPPGYSFFGEVRFPQGQYYVYATGIDGNGAQFQRLIPSPIIPIESGSTDTGLHDTYISVLGPDILPNVTSTPNSSISSSSRITTTSKAGPHILTTTPGLAVATSATTTTGRGPGAARGRLRQRGAADVADA